MAPALTGWTYCSGIGAPEVAAPGVAWALASEIEPFQRALLGRRFGHRDAREARGGAPALWGDFTALRPRHARRLGIPLPELLVAGTPCQAFSFAGLRAGVSDARGNLALEFIRHVHALAAAGPLRWALWENVPGVLSDRGNAFGHLLGGLVGAGRALAPGARGRWPDLGLVAGPAGRLAWRVFDARGFGLAQRRRRVFVLFCPGGRRDPAAVLFEPEGGAGRPGSRPAHAGEAAPDGGAGAGGSRGVIGAAFHARQHPVSSDTFTPALDTNRHSVAVAYAASLRGREGGSRLEVFEEDGAPALRAATGGASRPFALGADAGGETFLRRITPVEGERLFGFPEGWTAIPWKRRKVDAAEADWLARHVGAEVALRREGGAWITDAAPDSLRFFGLGNSIAVEVLRWIFGRLLAAEAAA